MANIAVLGGTFNPIHIGHLIIAQDIVCQKNIDKLIFVPNAIPPHKKSGFVIEAKHRYEMVKLAIKKNSHFDISDIELSREGYSYTIDTMEYFSQKFAGDNLFFIIGADSLYEINSWKNAETLINKFLFIIAKRSGSNLDIEDIKNNPFLIPFADKIKNSVVNTPNIDISSSIIRENVKTGKPISYLTDDKVINYISKHNLYK